MNYIREIAAFHDSLLYKNLSTGQIALWYALMYINNKVGWAEDFSVANQVLELQTGLSRGAVLKARNALQQMGYIDFKCRGTKATVYRMKSLVMSNSEQASEQSGVQTSEQSGVQTSDTLNKQNKTKHIKKESERKKSFTPPTLDEVKAYIAEKGYDVDPVTFFNFFSEGYWKDSKGQPVRNWKQKIITWQAHQTKPAAKKMGANAGYEQHKISDAEFDALFESEGF